MRLLRTVRLERRHEDEARPLREARRRPAADELGVARCPHCGGELVARMARGRPAFWCRCPVKRGLALGA
jgi:hypothetical protein